VLQLYRRILRALRDVPAEADRRHLQQWAREEFRRNKDATEEVRSGSWQSPAMSCAPRCAAVLFASITARLAGTFCCRHVSILLFLGVGVLINL